MTRQEFWNRLDRQENGCWLWRGNPSQRYPQVRWYGQLVTAHRLAFTLTNGAIDPGLEVCHTCDTPRCCNPRHLFAASHAENMRDAQIKGRLTPKKPKPPHRGRGEGCHRHRLKEADVRAIRFAVKQGIRQKTLAQQYGVTRICIHYVVTGKNWGWLE